MITPIPEISRKRCKGFTEFSSYYKSQIMSMSILLSYLQKYLQDTYHYKPLRFVFEMYSIAMVSKLLIIAIALLAIVIYEPLESVLFGEMTENSSQFTNAGWLEGLLILCIILPFLESIVGQGLPIWLRSRVTKRRAYYLFGSSIWFSYLHSIVFEGFALAMLIFSAGIVCAWSYTVYQKRGFWKAIIVITAIHFLYNFTAFVTFYAMPG